MHAKRIVLLRYNAIEQQKRLLSKQRQRAQKPTRAQLALYDIFGRWIGKQRNGHVGFLVRHHGDFVRSKPLFYLLKPIRMYQIASLNAIAIHVQGLFDGRKVIVYKMS